MQLEHLLNYHKGQAQKCKEQLRITKKMYELETKNKKLKQKDRQYSQTESVILDAYISLNCTMYLCVIFWNDNYFGLKVLLVGLQSLTSPV